MTQKPYIKAIVFPRFVTKIFREAGRLTQLLESIPNKPICDLHDKNKLLGTWTRAYIDTEDNVVIEGELNRLGVEYYKKGYFESERNSVSIGMQIIINSGINPNPPVLLSRTNNPQKINEDAFHTIQKYIPELRKEDTFNVTEISAVRYGSVPGAQIIDVRASGENNSETEKFLYYICNPSDLFIDQLFSDTGTSGEDSKPGNMSDSTTAANTEKTPKEQPQQQQTTTSKPTDTIKHGNIEDYIRTDLPDSKEVAEKLKRVYLEKEKKIQELSGKLEKFDPMQKEYEKLKEKYVTSKVSEYESLLPTSLSEEQRKQKIEKFRTKNPDDMDDFLNDLRDLTGKSSGTNKEEVKKAINNSATNINGAKRGREVTVEADGETRNKRSQGDLYEDVATRVKLTFGAAANENLVKDFYEVEQLFGLKPDSQLSHGIPDEPLC